jgi:predicted ATPase
LAEIALLRGHLQEGLKVISQALATSPATDVRYDMAELYRLKSALLMAHKPPHHSRAASKPWVVAEESAQQALALARCQGAKGWELRSAITLCRVWQQQGKGDVARQLLEPLYGWFSEGFDTCDLQQAKALLAELR